MAVRIQFRRDVAADWTAADPVLADGELGLETDTGLFKVGNGVDAWTDLGYSSGPAGPTGATGAVGPQGDPTTVNGKTGASITLDAADVGADPAGSAAAAQAAAEAYADTLGADVLADAEAYADANFILASEKGNSPGVATLGVDGKVLSAQLPALDYVPNADRAAANGVATLGADGKVPNAQLPPLAITDTHVVASQSAMLALDAQVGDVAVRSDQSKSYILAATPASTLANWQELLAPPSPVLSVDGRTGTVSLTDLYEPAGAVSAHEADTTSVHGIADTSLLETQAGAAAKADDAEVAAKAYTDDLFARSTVTVTTSSLAAGASADVAVTLAKSYRLVSVETDKAARVRLYTTTAARAADADRPIGTDPADGAGCVFEFIAAAGLLSVALVPQPCGSSMDATPSASIAMRVTNLSAATGTVSVTFKFFKLEV